MSLRSKVSPARKPPPQVLAPLASTSYVPLSHFALPARHTVVARVKLIDRLRSKSSRPLYPTEPRSGSICGLIFKTSGWEAGSSCNSAISNPYHPVGLALSNSTRVGTWNNKYVICAASLHKPSFLGPSTPTTCWSVDAFCAVHCLASSFPGKTAISIYLADHHFHVPSLGVKWLVRGHLLQGRKEKPSAGELCL